MLYITQYHTILHNIAQYYAIIDGSDQKWRNTGKHVILHKITQYKAIIHNASRMFYGLLNYTIFCNIHNITQYDAIIYSRVIYDVIPEVM